MAKKAQSYLMVCPRCGSTNVYHDLSRDMMAWGAPTRWLCKDCDYSAIVFPKMQKSKIGKFKDNLKQRTGEQEEIIDSANITKGFVSRKLNTMLLFVYVIGVTASLILLIYDIITQKNYVLPVFILLLILVGLIGVFLNKFIKNF